MKILYVATISNTLNAFMIPHIEFLVNQGHQVDIACNINRELDPRFTEYGCKVFNIAFQRSPIKKDNYIAYKRLKRLILKEKYDIVHTHTPVASTCVRLACRNINVKVLYTAHGFHFFKGAALKNWLLYYGLERILSRWTDIIITINNEDYENAKKMKLRENGKVYLVNGVGIDLNKFKPKLVEDKNNLRNTYGYNKDDFILTYVGELSGRKNQSILIKTVNELRKSVPTIKLLLVGTGSLENQYMKEVNDYGLSDMIHFLGFRKDIPDLMAISDIGVSSSKQEGLPVNVMEAMSTGLPLVVTNCRGNSDLVKNGENGYVVDIDNINDFANSIKEIYLSEQKRLDFGRKSIELINSYSLEKVLGEIKVIYKKIENSL